MNNRLLDAFENCLQDLEKGATVEESLAKYPQFAAELRPSLEAAVAARSLSVAESSLEAQNHSRTQVLGFAARIRAENPPKISGFRFPTIAFTALLIALILILGSRELVVVSAESLPGDSLYPIKRAVEDIRVQFAPNPEVKYEIESQYREQRIDETLVLIERGWQRTISFEGIVEQMAPAKWIVDGIPVILTEETILIGDIRLGSLIEIEGITTPEGWVEAHELHLREFEFIGQVESIEEDAWIISGEEFKINSITQIDSAVDVNDRVLVLVRSRDNGDLYALAILLLPSNLNVAVPSMNENSNLIAGKKAGDQFELFGKVDVISASAWVIDGYSVNVNLLTELKDEIMPGDYVKVHILLGVDGTVTALEIELASEDGEDDADDHSTDREDDELEDDLQDEDSDDDIDEENEGENDEDDEEDDDREGTSGDDNDDSDEDSDNGNERDDDADDGDNSGSSEDDDHEDDEPEESEETDEPDEPEETDEPEEPDD